MAPQQKLPIVLYHYPYSPYARRVLWYLQLRGIPFIQCVQPPILPREDLLRLDISHRRIPIMAIGRDIYLDSRLILAKLEKAYPPSESHPALPTPTPASPEISVLEPLFRSVAIDNGIFAAAAKLIPPTLPITRDPKFIADRAEFFGPPPASASSEKESGSAYVPEALNDIKAYFQLLESTLLSDGRTWILNTPAKNGPSLADLEAIWPLHWLTTLPGALPKEYISPENFPKVFAWIKRFDGAVNAAKKKYKTLQSKIVKGDEAEGIIRSSAFYEPEVGSWDVNGQKEPIVKFHGLEKGKSLVEIWPADTGVKHRDLGVLVGINEEEVVIEKVRGDGNGNGKLGGEGNVRVHAPRHGFRLRGVKAVSNL
ncbi:hypothetical protein V8F20_000506 [Naviculisporaceae sp. PSN 640]